MVREGIKDPEAFAESEARGAFIAALIPPVLIALGFLAVLFILGYTALWGGPYGVAKFFFWCCAIIYTVVGYTFYKVVTTLKRAVQAGRERMKGYYTSSTKSYREAEVVDGE